MLRRFLALAALFAALHPSTAAALTQPNGVTIPTAPGCNAGKPTGLLATFACACDKPGVCNIGAPCSSPTTCDDGKRATCESTMWHAFNDNTCIPSNASGLDPVAEASTTPETFHPTCALTFTLLTRGTAQFKNVFGWYNVTAGAPPMSDLHPMINCGDAAGAQVVLDISKEPAYAGGDVGFFLMTPEAHGGSKQCASGDCCPSAARVAQGQGYVYYSERKYNPDQAGTGSFIHLIVYNSHVVARKFYFAWEDIFGGTDDEFTDLVTSVEGVECSGGGVACDTGMQGVCASGVTRCDPGGGLGCVPSMKPSNEICNGLDDDCNGAVDDGATCPDANDVCWQGQCVHRCGGKEFPCMNPTACDESTGLCVDPACVGVSCPSGKTCAGGACVDACAGVVCPRGQTCAADRCVDPCAGVACSGGQVCRLGVCLEGCAKCDGVVCASGLKCDATSNDCVDPSCANGCPAGTYCQSGACVDACQGVKCPHGAACNAGVCAGPAGAPDAGSPGLSGGGNGGGGGDDGGSGPNADDTSWSGGKGGCACDVVDGGDGGGGNGVAAFVIAFATLGAWRFMSRSTTSRRRSSTKSSSRSNTRRRSA